MDNEKYRVFIEKKFIKFLKDNDSYEEFIDKLKGRGFRNMTKISELWGNVSISNFINSFSWNLRSTPDTPGWSSMSSKWQVKVSKYIRLKQKADFRKKQNGQ